MRRMQYSQDLRMRGCRQHDRKVSDGNEDDAIVICHHVCGLTLCQSVSSQGLVCRVEMFLGYVNARDF
jgi:hypothetical protein